jgi:hypothetical protein
MLRKILLVLLVLVAGFCTYVLTRPDTFHIERSATIAAPAPVVFARINDFHAWEDWSPWEGLDPQMKRTFSGPDSGPGATYAWVGNDKVGTGKMTITDTTPPSRVGIDLDFIKPFPANDKVVFTLVPEANGTKVTWAMDGKNSFASKFFGVFMNIDKMVGNDFEKGFASLNTAAAADVEKAANPAVQADTTAVR